MKHEKTAAELNAIPRFQNIIKRTKEANNHLDSTCNYVNPYLFRYTLMMRLGIALSNVSGEITCPGCGTIETSRQNHSSRSGMFTMCWHELHEKTFSFGTLYCRNVFQSWSSMCDRTSYSCVLFLHQMQVLNFPRRGGIPSLPSASN